MNFIAYNSESRAINRNISSKSIDALELQHNAFTFDIELLFHYEELYYLPRYLSDLDLL